MTIVKLILLIPSASVDLQDEQAKDFKNLNSKELSVKIISTAYSLTSSYITLATYNKLWFLVFTSGKVQ